MISLPAISNFSFAEPGYLALLVAPALLLVLWTWRLIRHRIEIRRFASQRVLPVRERVGIAGDFLFWLFLVLASSMCILALARPQARVTVSQRAGADIVILLDASASMYVNDVLPSRWQRSQQFLRTLAETLSWKGDRVALALFASRTSPQLRLTKDPNALFFFFDQLGEHSPFALESDTTWDTNIEEGIDWGLKLIATDESLFGRSRNAKAFVLVTDGQAWSGEVRRALEAAREQRVIVDVVGIGTVSGGMIPEPVGDDGVVPPPKLRSRLDQQSLREIARFGGGDYFEIGRESDREMAFRLISNVRKRASLNDDATSYEDLYWRFLLVAAVLLGLGTLLLRKRVELWWQAGGAMAALGILIAVLG
jgi:Ca-activated chloride channel family protein